MTNCSPAYYMMSNGHDPNRALLIQRILAAQQRAQRGIHNAHRQGPGANTLLGQFFGANVQDRYPWTRPAMMTFATAINPAPHFGMLQSLVRLNGERTHAEREGRLLFEIVNHEHSAQSMVSHQERLIQTNARAPTKSDHTIFISQLREREFAGSRVPRMAHGEIDNGTSMNNTTAHKKKRTKPKRDTKWLATYEEILQYKDEHGDCIVPRGFPPNPRLASWVAEQRKQYKLLQDGKNSSITSRRIELLDKIGFAWNAQEAAWERHITDLKAFKAENGDCLVPLNHPKYPKLGLWVKEQRRHYTLMKQAKPSHMTEERARALTPSASAGTRTKQSGASVSLGTWVHHQRRQYKKHKEGRSCHITDSRVRALDDVGFVWYPRERVRRLSEVSSSDSDTESESDGGDDEVFVRPKKRRRLHGK
ncbi:hypothetical protein MHU86_5258 [Fragilaria crotonensis]|nr:hypothetical protein MHU86_5258 [Fragilaria crotonensis]